MSALGRFHSWAIPLAGPDAFALACVGGLLLAGAVLGGLAWVNRQLKVVAGGED